MIKKIFTLTLSCMLMIITLAACGSNDNSSTDDMSSSSIINSSTNTENDSSVLNDTGEYKDGTYTGKVKNPVDGYYDYVTITIEDKIMTAIDFNSINDKNEYITADEAYKKSLIDKGNKHYPEFYYTEYAKNFMIENDIEKIKFIEGTDSVYNNFIILVSGVLNNAKNGVSDIFYFDNEVNK